MWACRSCQEDECTGRSAGDESAGKKNEQETRTCCEKVDVKTLVLSSLIVCIGTYEPRSIRMLGLDEAERSWLDVFGHLPT